MYRRQKKEKLLPVKAELAVAWRTLVNALIDFLASGDLTSMTKQWPNILRLTNK